MAHNRGIERATDGMQNKTFMLELIACILCLCKLYFKHKKGDFEVFENEPTLKIGD